MQKLLLTIDKISTFVGQAFSWLIVALTFMITWEVFSASPGCPALVGLRRDDISRHLFMMAGATRWPSRHVRGDVLYGFFQPRTQATIDLILYSSFHPGVSRDLCGHFSPPNRG